VAGKPALPACSKRRATGPATRSPSQIFIIVVVFRRHARTAPIVTLCLPSRYHLQATVAATCWM